MNLIMMGPPGAGKGTQAQRVCEQLNMPQISTGDILRAARDEKTRLGREILSYMASGRLVPDAVVESIVDQRLSKSDCEHGFILDGFPRTITQADALKVLLEKKAKSLDAVISLDVADDLVVKRLCGRRVCKECGGSYHLEFAPSKVSGRCDRCQGRLIQRKDDTEITIRERLRVYREQTEPLIKYYQEKSILRMIDGTGTVGEIAARIKESLEFAQ